MRTRTTLRRLRRVGTNREPNIAQAEMRRRFHPVPTNSLVRCSYFYYSILLKACRATRDLFLVGRRSILCGKVRTKSRPPFIVIWNFSFARALGNNEASSTSRTVRRFGRGSRVSYFCRVQRGLNRCVNAAAIDYRGTLVCARHFACRKLI